MIDLGPLLMLISGGLALLCAVVVMIGILIESRLFVDAKRPDKELWKPVGNADRDRVECYRSAARKLGLTIKVGYPIPGDNSVYCAQVGMKGIYLLRKQAVREGDLTAKMFYEEKLMRS